MFDSSTTFLNPLVGTNSLYGKRTVGFFSLASHALRACEARALRARKTLTPRFTDFFTDFEKKIDCFAVYCLKSVFVGLGLRRLADVAQKSRLLGNSALYIVSKQNDSSK